MAATPWQYYPQAGTGCAHNTAMSRGGRNPRRSLRGKVVVVTGASGGIGRATAVKFAAVGAHVVLAARREYALEDTARECRAAGASADVFVADVTSQRDMERVVSATLAQLGRIDVWVNNAGTTLFARLEDGEFAEHRQVLETNLMGPMYAARLLAPVFRRQRAGTLVNIGSVLSAVGQAYVPSYVISKFGLRGLSEAFRSEFANIPDVHVCTVLPYATDTPHFQDGGNAVGRRAHAMPPVQDPNQVADAVVAVAMQPRRQRYVPRYAVIGLTLHWLFPRLTERLLRQALEKFHLVSSQPRTSGNLFAPLGPSGTVHGLRRPVISTSALAVWAAGELLRIGAGALSRRSRGWASTRPTS
jgi:short-subunit dehydrogenase